MGSSKPFPKASGPVAAGTASVAGTGKVEASQGDAGGDAVRRGGRCPICTAPTEAAFRPFCSRRCADVDLSRWLRGGYAIAGRADVDEDGDDTIADHASRQTPKQDEDDKI